MNLLATMKWPSGALINANGVTPCVTRVARANRVDDHAADDEHERHPHRHEIVVGRDDPQSELGDAVAGDIEQRSEEAGLVALARDVTIQAVRDEDEDRQEEARERPRVRRLVEQPGHDEQQEQPAQRDEIRHTKIIRTPPSPFPR